MLIIICTAEALKATNALLNGPPFNATGENVSVPIITELADMSTDPQLYGCNWEAFSDEHFSELKKLAKGIDGLYVYDGKKELGFDKLLKRLRIKRKQSEAL